nr:hypothetical protein [Tanacetum cinerariifolium]
PEFEDLPLEHDILSFIRDIRHSGDIINLTDPKSKGLAVLSEVALTEAEQLKLTTKRSKTQFHSSHASGSGDGVDTQSKVHDDKDEDDVNDSDDISDGGDNDNDGNNSNDGDDDDANDDDKQESDDKNDDDKETDSDGTKSNRIKIPSRFEQEEEDAHVTLTPVLDTQNTGGPTQSSSVSSLKCSFENLELLETTTLLPALLDFASVFNFNERISNLEKDLSEMKQVDQYAKALSFTHAIVNCYIDNQLGLAINKAIQAHNFDYLKGKDLSRRYSTSVTKTKAATYDLKWIKDLVPQLWSPVQKYDYGHLEEIEVRRDDQKLYTFRECDFKRLRLQDIEDVLLLLIQQKLTNLIIKERYDLNVALCMYTRHIVIQRRVEDLQLGVESYQKKLNLTKPDIYKSNPGNKTAYTSYSNPHGIIYVDQYRRKRLMHADELHKFSDGMLNNVWFALHDIVAGIKWNTCQ